MPTTSIEPMDTYLCVLLQLELINPMVSYQQSAICGIIASNQTAFNAIYNDPAQRLAARTTFMDTAQGIVVVDKQDDCDQ